MSTTLLTLEGSSQGGLPPAGPAPAGGSHRRSLPILAGCVAASWLLPVALNAVRLDVLLLAILVVSVGSLVQVGGGLLDRLVVAGLIVAGAVLAFGLLFSLWPWGIGPVPTGGFLLSVVSVSGWLGRCRPGLPLRVRPSDLLVLGTAYAVWHYLHHPLIGRSPAERLVYFATAEDRLGHFSYFTGIQHVGGYNFLHQGPAKAYLMSPAEAVYPQGSHFLLAWIDGLVHSSADPGPVLGAMNRYFLYVLVAYALLCAALVWAARWIGGPRLRGWRCTAVCASVAALTLASNYADLVVHGFDSEIIGLLFLAVSLALLVRPAMGGTEFLLVSVAGLVTVSYAYNLYGAVVGVALVGTCVVHRRKFARRRWLLYGLQVGGVVLAALPSLISVLSKIDVASISNLGGPTVGADRTVLVGCGLLALLAAVTPGNRRTGAGRSHLVLVLGTAAVVGGFGWWQIHTIGYYSYYFEKIAAAGVVVSLISLGAVGTLLRMPLPRHGSVLRRRAGEAAVSAVTGAAALSLFAGVQWGFESAKGAPAAWYANPLVVWGRGEDWSDIGPSGAHALGDLPGVSGPVIALYSNDSYKNLKATWIAQLLRARGGDMLGFYEIHWVNIGGAPGPEAEYQDSMTHLRTALAKASGPPTILVADRPVADRIRHDLDTQGVQATVLSNPQNLWTGPWERTFPGD